MRHSHKMQQGGGFWSKITILMEKDFITPATKSIMDNIKNNSDIKTSKLYEYAKEIAEKMRVRRESIASTYFSYNPSNWVKKKDTIDNKFEEYFLAYNTISSKLNERYIKYIKANNPSIIKEIQKYYDEYLFCINQEIELLNDQIFKLKFLILLYESAESNTLEDFKEQKFEFKNNNATKNKDFIKYLKIDTDDILAKANFQTKIDELNAKIVKQEKRLNELTDFKTNASSIARDGKTNASSIARDAKTNTSSIARDGKTESSNESIELQPMGLQSNNSVLSNPITPSEDTNNIADRNQIPKKGFTEEQKLHNQRIRQKRSQGFKKENTQNSNELIVGVVGDPQLGGGSNEIIELLTDFIKKVDTEATEDIEESKEDTVIENQTLQVSNNVSNNNASIPSQIEMQTLNRGQQENNYTLEQIIQAHNETNAAQSDALIEQFKELLREFQSGVQGQSRESRGTGTETETGDSISRSLPENASSVVNQTVNKLDLSKLTSDTYAQTVRYLNLFKAIIEKRKLEPGAEDVIAKIGEALKTLQQIVDSDNSIVKINDETKESLKASNADIAEIMFSLLGIGATTGAIALGGKRKCKRSTIKRMKYRRDKKDKKKTQKKALDYK